MFHSLRTRLIAAFAVSIFLCLFLAGSAFLYLLRGYQTQIALQRLADLALPVALQVRALERLGASPDQVATVLAEQAAEVGIRILLVDNQARVVADTLGGMEGRPIQRPDRDISREGRVAFVGTYEERGRQSLYIVASQARQTSQADRLFPRSPEYSVVLAVPQQSVTAAWLELAPSLSVAALLSLLVSIVVAVFLSRSMSGPLAQITRAAGAMSKGKYDQTIPVKGRDEVGRLALAFNTMAREVAQSHATLRDFLANVSHELKTPLTSIQGFSQAMVEGALHSPEEYAEAGRIINEEAERMRRLVEGLLYLSKVESGQLTMEKQRVYMADLLQTSVRRWQRRIDEAGVHLEVRVDGVTHLLGDAHRLEQVLDNLLDNAFKYTPAGGTITVAMECRSGVRCGERASAASPVLEVSIHNTGSTIPPEDLTRVFERFYQVGHSRARNAGGSGLGLAIVKEIVQAHGGSVGVASTPESGTTFSVFLPCLQESNVAISSRAAVGAP